MTPTTPTTPITHANHANLSPSMSPALPTIPASTTPSSRSARISAIAFIAALPVVAVFLARTLAPTIAPSNAHAAAMPAGLSEDIIAPHALAPTPEQRLWMRSVRQALDTAPGPSPIVRPESADDSDVEPETSLDPTQFPLTSIMVAGKDPIAMIARKPRRVGDVVAPAWKLESIDPQAGIATLVGPDNERVVLQLRRTRED